MSEVLLGVLVLAFSVCCLLLLSVIRMFIFSKPPGRKMVKRLKDNWQKGKGNINVILKLKNIIKVLSPSMLIIQVYICNLSVSFKIPKNSRISG